MAAPRSLAAPPIVIEKLFAGLMLAVCLLLLVRVLIGARRRERFDAAWLRFRGIVRRRWRAVAGWPLARRRAGRVADEAILRARRRAAGDWEGNVYRPTSFKKKKRDLH